MKFFLICLLSISVLSACRTTSITRLQPGLIKAPERNEPLALVHVECTSFYFLFIPIPGCDVDSEINKRLMNEARKIGAHAITDIQLNKTPKGNFWGLTWLFGFRSTSVQALAWTRSNPAKKKFDLSESVEKKENP